MLTPNRIRYFNIERVPTTSDLIIDKKTMREIEQLGISELSQIEYAFVKHRDDNLGLN